MVVVISDQTLDVHRFPLAVGCHRLGAASDCEVFLPVPGVSRRHAEIEVMPDGGAVVRDLESRNGTRVAGRRVEHIALADWAELSVGPVHLRLEPLDPVASEVLVRVESSAEPAGSRVVSLAATTRGDSIDRRLIELARALIDEPPAARPQRLVDGLFASLALDSVTLSDDAAILAAGGLEGSSPSVVATCLGRALTLHGAAAPLLETRRELLEVCVALAIDPPHQPGPAPRPTPAVSPSSASPAMRRLYEQLGRIAKGRVAILLRGESGVGKEVAARWIHEVSPRGTQPFVALNCAAVPAELLEAELFGIERGVATGVEARIGLLQQASGGTLLLDEIGDMAPALQAKLLRAIESSEIVPVGARRPRPIDVRLISATHRDLEVAMAAGEFRRDLYHRLAGFEVEIPPLRDRPEDIPGLAATLLARELEGARAQTPGLSRGALEKLCAYRWPGNVRELAHEMAQAALQIGPGEPVMVGHLSRRVRGDAASGTHGSPFDLAQAVAAAETRVISMALAAAAGDIERAAGLLGISRATLYRRMRALGLAAGSPDSLLD